jgi:hypothetical protein
MTEMNLSNGDIGELLVVLNIALSDANEAIRHASDSETIHTLNNHQELIRKWITRLSQQIGSETQE